VGSALFDEQEYERGLRTLSSQLRVDDVVTFTGFRSDMAIVLEDLDIVVHASTLAEPFGQVIIEGMAAAKPVIATNGGGVAEILVHGETGLMVPMKDTGAMADAICELLADRTRRLEMGHKGRERVRAKFTLQRTALGVQAIYAKIQEIPPWFIDFRNESISSVHSREI
jgi:glycosyltransferase involved in cell wall biosynthesis